MKNVGAPWLIQLCNLADRKGGKVELSFMEMLAPAFKEGLQHHAVLTMLTKGLWAEKTAVKVHGQFVPVYLIGYKDFPFAEYQVYLQQLASNELRTANLHYFDEAVYKKSGVYYDKFVKTEVNIDVWFDIERGVMWCLSQGKQDKLMLALDLIDKAWKKDVKLFTNMHNFLPTFPK